MGLFWIPMYLIRSQKVKLFYLYWLSRDENFLNSVLLQEIAFLVNRNSITNDFGGRERSDETEADN